MAKGSSVRPGVKAAPRARNDDSNGLLKTLWADLARKELPHAGRPEDDVWFEQQQEERRELAARIGKVHNTDPDRRAKWRRWFSVDSI